MNKYLKKCMNTCTPYGHDDKCSNLNLQNSPSRYELMKEVDGLLIKLKCCKNDYWFMINLLENYNTDKEQAIKDCIERMKFRKTLFEVCE